MPYFNTVSFLNSQSLTVKTVSCSEIITAKLFCFHGKNLRSYHKVNPKVNQHIMSISIHNKGDISQYLYKLNSPYLADISMIAIIF